MPAQTAIDDDAHAHCRLSIDKLLGDVMTDIAKKIGGLGRLQSFDDQS